jgi:hypothetical protein
VAVGRGLPGWNELDHRATLRGARAYLIIAVPCGVLAEVVHSGGWLAVVEILLLVAPIVGGAVAASSGDRAPLTQAAIAVSAPTAAFFVIRILVGAARGKLDAALLVSLALYLAIVIGLGILGGYLGFRRRTRTA